MTRRRLSPDQRRLVRERQGNLCSCGCNEPLAARVEYDHDTALWAGGDNDIANFRALRPGCHTKKTVSEAKQRGKEKRIREQDGLRRKKLTRKEKIALRWAKRRQRRRKAMTEAPKPKLPHWWEGEAPKEIWWPDQEGQRYIRADIADAQHEALVRVARMSGEAEPRLPEEIAAMVDKALAKGETDG